MIRFLIWTGKWQYVAIMCALVPAGYLGSQEYTRDTSVPGAFWCPLISGGKLRIAGNTKDSKEHQCPSISSVSSGVPRCSPVFSSVHFPWYPHYPRCPLLPQCPLMSPGVSWFHVPVSKALVPSSKSTVYQ